MSVWPNHNTRYSNSVISPHRMHAVQSAAYCYVCSTGLCVCVFLCVVEFGEPMEPCVRMGQNPSMESGILGGICAIGNHCNNEICNSGSEFLHLHDILRESCLKIVHIGSSDAYAFTVGCASGRAHGL